MRLPHLRRPRLSYANVTATLALVVATSTGGAYAAATIGSANIKDNAVKSRHIDAGHVRSSDVYNGAVGQVKLGADVGAPRAYGTIWHSGGTVTNARNLSLANVTHPETGVYCIQGLLFTPKIAVATSAYEPNASHHDLEIYGLMGNWGNEGPRPEASQIQVRVYSPGRTTEANGNFNIVIFYERHRASSPARLPSASRRCRSGVATRS